MNAATPSVHSFTSFVLPLMTTSEVLNLALANFELRYESQGTISLELIFSALVDEDGARNMRFERALRTQCYPGSRIDIRLQNIL
jgi:hypothetical protein